MSVAATSAERFHGLAILEALNGSDVTSNELYQKAYRAYYKEHDGGKALAL